jgi:hypothetical protein
VKRLAAGVGWVLVAFILLYLLLRVFGPALFTLTVWSVIMVAAVGITRLVRRYR